MARRTNPATAVSAIAVMLGMIAIANAAQEEGPRWPNIYEPQWPNVAAADTRLQKAASGRVDHTSCFYLKGLENHIVGGNASPQPVDWKVASYGVFARGSSKFGPYPTGGYF